MKVPSPKHWIAGNSQYLPLDTNTSCSFYHFYILFPFSELKATFHTQSMPVISRHSVLLHLSTAWPLSPSISQHSPECSRSPSAAAIKDRKGPGFTAGSVQDSRPRGHRDRGFLSVAHGQAPHTLATAAVQHAAHHKFQPPTSLNKTALNLESQQKRTR